MCREEIDLVTITILGPRGFIAKGEIKKGIFLYRNFLDFVAGLVGPETIPCSLSLLHKWGLRLLGLGHRR
jgi:hypothetical protein